jgi:hypothetical protein
MTKARIAIEVRRKGGITFLKAGKPCLSLAVADHVRLRGPAYKGYPHVRHQSSVTRRQRTVTRDAFARFVAEHGTDTGFPFVVEVAGDELNLLFSTPIAPAPQALDRAS